MRYLFLPLWAPIYGRGWSENDYFYGKIASEYKAASRERQPTWKVSSAPYHIPIHGRAWLRAIFTLSRYPSRVPGVQKWLFLCLKSDQNGRSAPAQFVTPGKCLVCHITPQCMWEHNLGPYLPFPGTYPGSQGFKNGYFYGKNHTLMAGLLQPSSSHLESV